jgi:CRP/FNR family nitrogen fixation transcriptional regulator
MESLAALSTYGRGQEIHTSGVSAKNWYRLVSGLARMSALQPDGRRQVVDFLLPGDYFGFTARDRYASAAEAVVDGTGVVRYPRRHLELLADSDPDVRRYLREQASEAVGRAYARALILGRSTALERVGAFLAQLASCSLNGSAGACVVPWSCRDIANCLGLAVETVGSALLDLEQAGVISLGEAHGIQIVDQSALQNDRYLQG